MQIQIIVYKLHSWAGQMALQIKALAARAWQFGPQNPCKSPSRIHTYSTVCSYGEMGRWEVKAEELPEVLVGLAWLKQQQRHLILNKVERWGPTDPLKVLWPPHVCYMLAAPPTMSVPYKHAHADTHVHTHSCLFLSPSLPHPPALSPCPPPTHSLLSPSPTLLPLPPSLSPPHLHLSLFPYLTHTHTHTQSWKTYPRC